MSYAALDSWAQVAELALLLALAIVQAVNRVAARKQVSEVAEKVTAVVRSVDSLRPAPFVERCDGCQHKLDDHDDRGCRERFCGCPGWTSAEARTPIDVVKFVSTAPPTPLPRGRVRGAV